MTPKLSMELKNMEVYKEKLLAGNPEVKLVRPCHLEDGIISLESSEIEDYARLAKKLKSSIGFFIPASGSGSRMFSFVYQYLAEPSTDSLSGVEQFFGRIEELALFQQLPSEMQSQIRSGAFDMKEVLTFILTQKGLDIGALPKALIPFHKVSPFVMNALQEQIIQAQNTHANVNQVHFTIQEKYQGDMDAAVELLRKGTGTDIPVDFSYQNPETDVPAMNDNLEIARDTNGAAIMRPSGHGALLHNLNEMTEDIVLIKNIDNVQHWENRDASKKWWNVLIGILTSAQEELHAIVKTENRKAFASFNEKYQILDSNWVDLSDEELFFKLNRPFRVCGMVRNVGQPGGGPYWIEDGQEVTKQIVEKSQIAPTEDQRNKMIRSTHFNPVMLAISTKNKEGEKHDLLSYVDVNKYFVVEKTQEGEQIKYIELPGLWNGSMANWNTIFVEVPSSTFSPVKSVLDLLDPLHQPKNA